MDQRGAEHSAAAINYTTFVIHLILVFMRERIMKNVTITLDEETAAWARVYAAQHNMSVSRLVGEMLHQRMGELSEYDRAMRAFLAKKPVKLSRSGGRYPKREELYDRGRLR
ncbi:MAG TPA: DUF6364 family protein [Casimicrobiaceae bacterium]|jgi:hypothetical protein|nr:DUF6364 family protein [Casimicrobiaceae bacterium]